MTSERQEFPQKISASMASPLSQHLKTSKLTGRNRPTRGLSKQSYLAAIRNNRVVLEAKQRLFQC